MFQGNYKRNKRKARIETAKQVGLMALGFVIWIIASSFEGIY